MNFRKMLSAVAKFFGPEGISFKNVSVGSPYFRYDPEALRDLVFRKNVVAYRCILDIARAVASIPFEVRFSSDGDEATDDGLTKYFERPNPFESFSVFTMQTFIDLLLYGNAFLLKVDGARRTTAVWRLPPTHMSVTFDGRGVVSGYQLKDNYGEVLQSWRVDGDGNSPVLHLAVPGVREKGKAVPPLFSAAVELAQYLEAGKWNVNLLTSGGSVGGVLESERELTEQDLQNIRSELSALFSGSSNAGKFMVLDRLSFKPFNVKPNELGVMEFRIFAARMICQAFGYPPFLLGLPEGATFNNVAEARLALWDNVIVPYAEYYADELSRWIWPDRSFYFVPVFDETPAGEVRNAAKWSRLVEAVKVGILSINEARQELGYESIPGGDVLLVPPIAMPVGAQEGPAPAPDDEES